ncbi:unnamed protein product [Merluccius merluccius]
MERCLRWSRGRLLREQDADDLIACVVDLISEVNNRQQVPTTYGYRAPLVQVGRGPPSYEITREQLIFLVHLDFNVKQIADILHVSKATIKRRLRYFQLNRARRYAVYSNQELDNMVRTIVGVNDQIGPESVRAQLRAQGVRVQRRRVRDSMIRTNPQGAALRAMSQRLQRRTYRVAGPNSLWHIDGNHKLINWRIVIHGGIDGFSRAIVFLKASNNNRSSTVMGLYTEAIRTFGVPSRVRCDHGGENNDVCLFMDIFRGSSTGSSIRGRSTHNQRIERLWRDLWNGITNTYHSLFHLFTSEGTLDPDNEMHIWALHYIYLPRINRDLELFSNRWNNHGIRTEGHRTPLQIFVQGSLSLQGQPLRAVVDIFAVQGTDDIAAAQEEHRPMETGLPQDDRNDVDIQETLFALDSDQLQQLSLTVDPMGGVRGELGMDLYLETLAFIRSLGV